MALTEHEGPLVLIYHTHATESFERYDSEYYDTRNTWRSTDNNNNMVAVGAAMAHALEQAGIGVIHDTTQHDYPSYNGSYERSAETIQQYLEQYPSIKIILDLHRDAMERENQTIVKPVVEIDGRKAAQIMIIAGADNGSMGMEHWKQNMRFACDLQNAMERNFPQLTRPILLSHRKYNQHLSTGALLLEFGSNANTLEEAVYSAEMAGRALAELIYQSMEDDASL
ncbi:MAG TPA: stage II sporulation protein P [Clostridiales bacterium]|nr:stage II sporulation protein P [Clostridiales bacterium]